MPEIGGRSHSPWKKGKALGDGPTDPIHNPNLPGWGLTPQERAADEWFRLLRRATEEANRGR